MAKRGMEKTLDPEDWDETVKLGQRMVADMMKLHRTSRDRLVFNPWEKVFETFKEKAPREPIGMDGAYRDFNDILLANFPAPLTPPRVLGLGSRDALPLRHALRHAYSGHKPVDRVPHRPHDTHRKTDYKLDQGGARLPRRGERPLRRWRVNGQPHRLNGRKEHESWLRHPQKGRHETIEDDHLLLL